MVFVGIDWAEKHHDVCIIDKEGVILAKGRVVDGVEGISKLHELVADHIEAPEDAIVGIELDRGLLVGKAFCDCCCKVHTDKDVDGELFELPVECQAELTAFTFEQAS